MDKLDLIALIITILAVTCFSVVFTLLFGAYTKITVEQYNGSERGEHPAAVQDQSGFGKENSSQADYFFDKAGCRFGSFCDNRHLFDYRHS